MKTIKMILFFLTIILNSCKNNRSNQLVINKDSIKFEKFPKQDKISFNNLIEYVEGTPQEIHVIDSILMIRNGIKGCNFLLYNYSINKKEISKGYIAKGKGPFESIGGSKSGVLKDKIWLYDLSISKVIFLDKKKFILNQTDSLFQEFDLKKQKSTEFYFYGNVSFIDTVNYLGVDKWGSQSKSKMEKNDLILNQEIKGFGEFAVSSNKLNLETIRGAHKCHIYFNYKKNKAVMAYRYSDIIEIYNINSGDCVSIQGPENHDVYFTQDKGAYYFMGKTEDTKKTFVGGTFTNEFIYLIYSGHQRKNKSESDRFKWQTGEYVYVYDWKGNPVRKISLDRRVNSIGVSEDNKTLYSYDLDTGFLINSEI